MAAKKKVAKSEKVGRDLSREAGIGLAKPDKSRPYRDRENLDREDALDATISFRTTHKNKRTFEAACESGGWSKSDYLRMLQEGMQGDEKKQAVVSANEIAYQIRKAGNNINQIAHSLNLAARYKHIDLRIAKATIVQLDAIRRAMVASLEGYLED